MATQKHSENKVEHAEVKMEDKTAVAEHEKKHEHQAEKTEEKKTESKTENKKADKETKEDKKDKKGKETQKPIVKKYEAVAYGVSLPISKKQGTYICGFIKNKSIDRAIKELSEVLVFKRAIPFKGEIPHRKGKGMMSGRYPITACHEFINLLKGLKGNVTVAGLDMDKTRIYIASSSWASRPARSGGRKAKRSNVILRAKEFPGAKNG